MSTKIKQGGKLMFRSVMDNMSRLWQGRFRHGVGLALGGVNINRYNNGGWVLGYFGPNVTSAGTGHWPWFICEAAVSLGGDRNSWHIGLLGCTIGKIVVNDYDSETHKIVGPDKNKYYCFFKCINHQQKELGEIISTPKPLIGDI